MTAPNEEKQVEDNRPNSQKDLELRLAADHDPKKYAAAAAELAGDAPVSYAVEDNDTSGYIGVSPEYATYANDTEKPLQADGGVEADAEERLTRPTLVNKVVVEVESKQIDGTGSTQPLVYSEVSGDVYKTEEYKGDTAPTTVEELSGSTSPAPKTQPGPEAPQGADSPAKKVQAPKNTEQ